jgi:hypothetical protein
VASLGSYLRRRLFGDTITDFSRSAVKIAGATARPRSGDAECRTRGSVGSTDGRTGDRKTRL